jgi:exopolysaccharide biosynthesis polyprenyl glycosylphosphotransferase
VQHDFEHGKPLASTPSISATRHDVLPLLEEVVDENHYSPLPNRIDSRGRIAQESQAWKQQRGRRRQGLQPVAWRLIAIVGDGVLLVLLLAFVLLLAALFHPALFTSWYKPDMWYSKLILGCLVLIFWSIAARITQAHALVNISGRLAGPLCASFALILMLILSMAITYPFITNKIAYDQGLLFYLVLATPALCIWRFILADIINSPRFRPQAVIIGANVAGEIIANELRNAKRYTANVVGYISTSPEEKLPTDELSVLGDRNILSHLMQSGMIDMIIMAIDYKANPDLFQEAIEAAQLGIAVIPMTVAYERTTGKIPVEHVGDQWYIALPSEVVVSPLYLCWRKLLDIIFGLLGTICIFLIFPVLAPMIYLDAPGPIFYKQERLGRNGRTFTIYKFRSMYANAEHAGQAQWVAEDDARVTRTGRFMRAIHLDELPQAFNILRGEMSLIGPRPERQEFVSKLERSIPFYRCRLGVKPGLTGWAQVKYGYGRTSQDALEKLQYDLYYIKHQSFMLDIFIILRTIAEVLLHRGA